MILRVLSILVLVAANAFFVAAEFALVRARRPRLEAEARERSRSASWALRALTAMPRMLSTCQVGITLATLGVGVLLASAFAAVPIGGAGQLAAVVRVVLAFLIVAYLHLVFGELVPRGVALARPERMLRLLAPPLLASAWVMRPLTLLLVRSARSVARQTADGELPEDTVVHSPDELRLLVERSQEGGALLERDAALLEGVFEFSEKNAREVMTPRTDIVAIAADATLEETLALVEEHELSRYPVYDGTIDNIVGILLAKDVLPALHRAAMPFSVRDIMRPAHLIPGTREVEEVLADFKRLKAHMAIVLDEYGGTAGVVTMEDLLEEIVGEIADEYDEPEPRPGPARGGETIVAGELNIGELNERFGVAIPEEEYTTIGGFVFGSLGRVPRVGDAIIAGGATFTVRAMEGRRVAQVAVKLRTTGVADADARARPPA